LSRLLWQPLLLLNLDDKKDLFTHTHTQTKKQTKNKHKHKKHKNKKRWTSIEKQPQQQHLGEEILQRTRHSEVNGVA
jgi:hypothetical protein